MNETGNEAGRITVGLPKLAGQLARLRPSYPDHVRPHISKLEQQCRQFHRNPDGIRPRMIETIEAIEGGVR